MFVFLRNVFSNYVLTAVTGLMSFLLTPILFHSLHPTNYAILTFAVAATSLVEAFDIGLSSVLIRIVSDLSARRRYGELKHLVSTAFYLLTGLGLLGTAALVGLSSFLATFFHLAGDSSNPGAMVIAMLSLSIAFQLPSAAVRGFLLGCQNFHLANAVDVACQFLRAALTLILLHRGMGLLAVAALYPLTALLRLAALLFMVRVSETPIWPSLSQAHFASLRRIWGFASLTFMEDASTQWFFQLDNLLAARLLSLPQLAILVVARRVPSALIQLSHQTLTVATPIISAHEAYGDYRALRKFVLLSTRNLLAVVLPLAVALSVWTEPILRFWVGPEVLSGVPIFRVFLIFAVFASLQEVPVTLVYGVGKVGFSAALSVVMLVVGVIVGAGACSRAGLWGLAVAFAVIQAVGTCLLFGQALPLAQVDLRLWIRKAVLPVFWASIPAGAWLGISYQVLPHNLFGMAASVIPGLLLFGVVFTRLVAGPGKQPLRVYARKLLTEID